MITEPYYSLRSGLRVFFYSVLLLTSIGCQHKGILDPKGTVGAQEKQLIVNSAEVMLAIGIPTLFLIIFAAFWFRKGNKKANYRPTWVFSGRLELLMWVVSGLAILVLSSYAWIGSFELDPGKPLESENKAIEIDVVSLEWKWLFIYKEENIAMVNELVIPVDTPVFFRLTSEDVMTSFFIPQLGSQIYTMSGMANRLYLEADEIGEYRGIAAHYNGAGFSDMHFQTKAVSEKEYLDYIRKIKAEKSTNSLTQNAYDELRKESSKVAPIHYGSVSEDLFSQIVMRKVPKNNQQPQKKN
ncbi:COX aromatic rich motif-containing protein [Akkermansiaceae bacterium]|nr:COX aromatic rich motif-containing protein [Akkermansiaceae bacterium]